MWILALETTSAHGSLALLRDDVLILERALESRHYSSEIFAALDAALAQEHLRLEDIGLFAVADGPGSFTGVRQGLTTVKGLVEVLGTPAVAVSTLRAVAGLSEAPALAALDASRGEVYYGVYPEEFEGLEPLAAFRQRLLTAARRALTPHPQLQQACPELELVSPLLAPAVGHLGLREYRRGHTSDALRLDARYLRRSDAELFARL